MATQLTPYLTFNGNCREAMEFYAKVFDGELNIMPFSEAPMEIPEEAKDQVLHSSLSFNSQLIMASDTMPGNPVIPGNTVTLSVAVNSEEEGMSLFEVLSEGGKILMPYEKVFWGAMFGMCTDKYEINWMVNYEFEQ